MKKGIANRVTMSFRFARRERNEWHSTPVMFTPPDTVVYQTSNFIIVEKCDSIVSVYHANSCRIFSILSCSDSVNVEFIRYLNTQHFAFYGLHEHDSIEV